MDERARPVRLFPARPLGTREQSGALGYRRGPRPSSRIIARPSALCPAMRLRRGKDSRESRFLCGKGTHNAPRLLRPYLDSDLVQRYLARFPQPALRQPAPTLQRGIRPGSPGRRHSEFPLDFPLPNQTAPVCRLEPTERQ